MWQSQVHTKYPKQRKNPFYTNIDEEEDKMLKSKSHLKVPIRIFREE